MDELIKTWKIKVRIAVNRHNWPWVKRLLTVAAATGSASDVVNSTAVLHSAISQSFDMFITTPFTSRVERRDCARFLLVAGARVDVPDDSGMTPLLTAANSIDLLKDNKTEILQLLLSAGASIHDRSPDGRTALHYAAGCADAVRLLLQAGAGAVVHHTSSTGHTALHYAAGCADAVRLLLQAGANATIQHASSSGHTALHYAAASGSAASVHMLLEAGADIAAVDADGLTPLSYAVLQPHCAAADRSRLFAMMFAAGATVSEVNARNSEGAQALHIAVTSGRIQQDCSSAGLLALVSAGADVNAANRFGYTPVHYAVNRDMAGTVTDLLSAGAAADIPDLQGKSALSWAARRAVKYPYWSPESGVRTFKAMMQHHSKQPFPAAALVVAAGRAAKPSRRGRIRTPDQLQNQCYIVHQLLSAAVQQEPAAARAALQQHWPESRQAAVTLACLVLDVWSATVADAAKLEAGWPAVQQMVMRVAAVQADSSAAQQQDVALGIAASQLS